MAPRPALTRLGLLATLSALPGCWIYVNEPEDEAVGGNDAAVLGGAGGSSAGGAGGGDAGTGGDAPPTCPERRATYPAGPYDTDENDVIANLAFEGPDGKPVDFQALRADCTANMAVITTSAGWCTACREEQPRLQTLYDDYRARGLLVVVTLFEDDNYAPADADLAEGWRDRYELTFPVLVDAEFRLGDYYDRDQTPMTMILNLETMKIGLIATGYDDDLVRSLVEALL